MLKFLTAAIISLALTAIVTPAQSAPSVRISPDGFEFRLGPDRPRGRGWSRGYESCRRHWHQVHGHRHCIWVKRGEERAWRRHRRYGH